MVNFIWPYFNHDKCIMQILPFEHNLSITCFQIHYFSSCLLPFCGRTRYQLLERSQTASPHGGWTLNYTGPPTYSDAGVPRFSKRCIPPAKNSPRRSRVTMDLRRLLLRRGPRRSSRLVSRRGQSPAVHKSGRAAEELWRRTDTIIGGNKNDVRHI